MTPRFTNMGKQVLDRGAHYADARDIPAAEAITAALNACGNVSRPAEGLGGVS
jgi:hypothetical protein